jgi:peptidoglycan lytic transglycosylase
MKRGEDKPRSERRLQAGRARELVAIPRRRRLRVARGCGIVLVLALISGCTSTPHSGGETGGTPSASVGGYKVGKPYQIKGVWYYPQVDYQYSEVGVASWYGPGFDGRSTANGETYDMNDLTAAHRTLPLPSIVRVTNLDNGRSINLRVNDRGPFVGNRIIDVSRRGAQMLGFYTNGTARVQVDIVEGESRALASALGVPSDIGAAAPEVANAAYPPSSPFGSDADVSQPSATPEIGRAPVSQIALAPIETASSTILTTSAEADRSMLFVTPAEAAAPVGGVPVGPTRYVQAGAFADVDRADRVRQRLEPIGPVVVSQSRVGGRDLVRVRIGPLDTEEEAERMLASVSRAGFPDCRLIVE